MQTLANLCSTVAKAHHLLNLVSQDSTVAADYLLEDSTFVEILTAYANGEPTELENGYNALMEHINQNY